jgi:hypothetical protein
VPGRRQGASAIYDGRQCGLSRLWEAELRIADQDFGSAEARDSAINASGYHVGSGAFCGDVVGVAALRVAKPPVRPMALTVGLQPPDDGQAAQRSMP